MKKTIILILLFLLTFTYLNCANYIVDIIQGEENIDTVVKSKPISVLLTMDNTMHLNESFDDWLKQYNAKQKDKGKPELDKEKMIQEMRQDLTRRFKTVGGKWGLKLIENKDEAKEGYILSINIEQIRPVPMVSYTGKYLVIAYKSDSDEPLFKVKLDGDLHYKKSGYSYDFMTDIGLPEDTLKNASELLTFLLRKFLMNGK